MKLDINIKMSINKLSISETLALKCFRHLQQTFPTRCVAKNWLGHICNGCDDNVIKQDCTSCECFREIIPGINYE